MELGPGDKRPFHAQAARTAIEGFDQFGLPRLLEGDRIQATVRECSASGGRYKVVPDLISQALSGSRKLTMRRPYRHVIRAVVARLRGGGVNRACETLVRWSRAA